MYMVPFYSETSYIASGWDEYCLMATFRLALGFLILSAIAIVCCHWLILKSLSKKSVGSKNFFEIYQIICCHRFSILIFSVDDFLITLSRCLGHIVRLFPGDSNLFRIE